jgi:hypothetical protein
VPIACRRPQARTAAWYRARVRPPRPDPSLANFTTGRERTGLPAQLVDAVATRLLESPLADALIERVLEALIRSAALERFTNQVVAELEASPAVDALVDRQVRRVLQALEHSEELATLIERQAGRYLVHLGEHPEPVQRLIQDQSRSAVRDFRDALRERALAGDDAVDVLVRRVLRRR